MMEEGLYFQIGAIHAVIALVAVIYFTVKNRPKNMGSAFQHVLDAMYLLAFVTVIWPAIYVFGIIIGIAWLIKKKD